MHKFIKILYKPLLVVFVLGYIVFEEVIWNKIVEPIYNNLVKYDVYNNVMNKVIEMNKYVVLMVFLSFFVLSEVMGIYSLAVLAQGAIVLGVFVYAIKFVPVFIAFSVLEKAKPKLFEITSFKYVYLFVTNTLDKIKSTKIYTKTVNNIRFYTYVVKRYFMRYFKRFYSNRNSLQRKIEVIRTKVKQRKTRV